MYQRETGIGYHYGAVVGWAFHRLEGVKSEPRRQQQQLVCVGSVGRRCRWVSSRTHTVLKRTFAAPHRHSSLRQALGWTVRCVVRQFFQVLFNPVQLIIHLKKEEEENRQRWQRRRPKKIKIEKSSFRCAMVLRRGGSCLRSSGRPLSSLLPGTGTSSCSSRSSRRSVRPGKSYSKNCINHGGLFAKSQLVFGVRARLSTVPELFVYENRKI